MANFKYKVECVIETDSDFGTMAEASSRVEGFTEFIKECIASGLIGDESMLSLTVTEL